MDKNDKQEILEAINASSSAVQGQIDGLKQEMGSMKQEVGSMKQEVGSMKQEMGSMKQEMGSMKQEMVTKKDLRQFEQKVIDKMAEGFADVEGALVTRQRKEDQKINLIVDVLEQNKLAAPEQLERIRRIKLFPAAPETS